MPNSLIIVGGWNSDTYSSVVDKALSLECEPSFLPAADVVRILLSQVPHFVKPLTQTNKRTNKIVNNEKQQ